MIERKMNWIENVLAKVQREPNYEVFEYKGYKCMIRRNMHMGTLCGYVGLSKSHPLFRQGYNEIEDMEVHGGLTFADFWDDENDGLWYLGFDCAHAGDFMPFMEDHMPRLTPYLGDSYKDIEYVRGQIKKLVDEAIG